MKTLKLILLALVLLAVGSFAISNRHEVGITMMPLSYRLEAPLFVVMFAALIAGIIMGGLASWAASSRLRRKARESEKKIQALENEIGALKLAPGKAMIQDGRG